MKIAVVTTHYANNYGALLQTFALQKYLNNELGQDAVALAYFPPGYKISWGVFHKPRSVKEFLRFVFFLLNMKKVRAVKIRAKKNELFINDNILRSKKSYFSEKDIINDRPDFDCYICGSDQVWNLRLINDPVFYLDFTKHFKGVKKIAYAPSIADPIPPDLVCKVKEYLKNIDAISVRESTDVEVLKSLTDKPVFHVADPVFLLCAEEWSKLLVSPSIKEPYILCFFIHTDPLAVKAVEKLRRLTGYPVVHVNLNVMDKFHSEYCVYDADPFDFIGYIKNAAFVCTNSFHCTAFSLIFKKNYYIVPRRVVNTRMESLHKVFGVQNRFLNLDKVKSMTIDDLSVDYSKFDIGYEFFRDQSINYLKKALEL